MVLTDNGQSLSHLHVTVFLSKLFGVDAQHALSHSRHCSIELPARGNGFRENGGRWGNTWDDSCHCWHRRERVRIEASLGMPCHEIGQSHRYEEQPISRRKPSNGLLSYYEISLTELNANELIKREKRSTCSLTWSKQSSRIARRPCNSIFSLLSFNGSITSNAISLSLFLFFQMRANCSAAYKDHSSVFSVSVHFFNLWNVSNVFRFFTHLRKYSRAVLKQ